MLNQLRPALLSLAFLSLITGVAYPLTITAFAKSLFPAQAAGSLIVREGVVVGSSLIGQEFPSPRYFHGRPSATSPPYNGAASSGSNLGPTNPALIQAVSERVESIRAELGDGSTKIPADLVTASGSGLDPHITPAAASLQVDRVAAARGLSAEVVQRIVDDHIEGRTLGLLGDARVNVLLLNLALDDR